MERNRETRGGGASILSSNGFNRRRHRTNSLRDSPDEDGGVELQESVRLRDRMKKERERERNSRERLSRSRRRRGDDETSEEECINDDDEDGEDEENTGTTNAAVRLLPPPPPGSVSNHHHSHSSTNNHHLQQRNSFPPGFSSSSKAFRASPVWTPGDEIISVSVPRKARSASTKRSHDWISSCSNNINGGGGGGAEQIFRQASSFPARQSGVVSTSTPSPASPMSPSNSFLKKKLVSLQKPNGNNIGPKLKPPKASPSKQNSPNPEELEIEIAEVLYGLMTQPEGPFLKSSPISNSGPLQAVAPKRKRYRQAVENPGYINRPGPVSVNVEMDQVPKNEISSPKIPGSTGENGFEVGGNSVNSQGQPLVAEESIESKDLVMKEKESCAVKNEDKMIKRNSMVTEVEIQREQKLEIDLMVTPRARSSPDRAAPLDQKPILSTVDAESRLVVLKDKENEEGKSAKEKSGNVGAEETESKGKSEETEAKKEIDNNARNIDLQFDLEKSGRNENAGKKFQHQQEMPIKANKDEPLQGAISMDGTIVVAPSPIQPLFTQPRPKRCATHCYIARNIHCLQQFMKTSPLWQAAAGPTSFFGSKSCNLNHGGNDKGSQTVSSPDSAQRKQQILIQQAMPSVGRSNLLGPAFIFPLNQQQAAATAAASARPSSAKPFPTTTGGASSSNPSSSAGACASLAAAAGTAAAMSFNYPHMAAANETQFLQILPSNGYPFTIPAVGAHPPNYRGPPSQTMPLFNGSFYPSQMIIQHHQKTPSTRSPQQAHQNATASNASSSSQKNLPSQQPRPQSSGVNSGAGSANLQNFPGQNSQLSNNQHKHPSRPRYLESEAGREDSPTTTTDSRGSRAPVNSYGPNFAMPIHPQNFALMTQQPPPQQQQFAMSFGAINGCNTLPGIDITSMAQNHAIFQSFPETTRQNIQMMAAQKNNNFRSFEGDKSGACDSLTNNGERKSLSEKAQSGVGQQSIAFRRSDLADQPVSSIQATNVVIESSSRSVNVSSGAVARTSRPVTNNFSSGAINVSNIHIQGQLHQQQMAINRSKTPVTSNGPVFSEHLNLNSSSIMAAKFSSVSKGSPRTTSSTYTNTKTGQNPMSSAQQLKNSPSNPTPESPSILGNPNVAKTPIQPQLFFSNPYSQAQSPHSISTSPATSGPIGFYTQWRRSDQHQQPGLSTSSNGVLSLGTPVMVANTSTNDPAKAIAAATSNVKGGGLSPHGVIHTAQFGAPSGGTLLPAGFSYVHTVPAVVQVKSAEQKPAGNDNLHPWQPEKK